MTWGSALEQKGYELADLARTKPQEALRGTLDLLENDWVLDYEGYDEWLLTAGECLERMSQHAAAALTWLGREDLEGTLNRLSETAAPRERAALLERAGKVEAAARLCGRMGCWARAAVVYETAGRLDQAEVAWQEAIAAYPADVDPVGHTYAQLGLAQLLYKQDDPKAQEPLTAGLIGLARLAVAAEDDRDLAKAQQRYRTLATIGSHTGQLEDLLEGAVNLARLLVETGDIQGALEVRVGAAKACREVGAAQAAATLWHEASALAARTSPLAEQALRFLEAQAWDDAADHIVDSDLLESLAENALLARIDALMRNDDLAAVRDTFGKLADLDLPEEQCLRYAKLAKRYARAGQNIEPPDLRWLQRFRLVKTYDRWCAELIEREYGEDIRAALLMLTVKADSILGRRRALRGLLRMFLGKEDRVESTINAVVLLAAAINQPIPRKAILKLLHDPSPQVREVVVATLGPISRREATVGLVEALRDSDAGVVETAHEALLDNPRSEAVPMLLKAARAGSVEEARMAVELLGALGDDPAALDALFELSRAEMSASAQAAVAFESNCPGHLRVVYRLREEHAGADGRG